MQKKIEKKFLLLDAIPSELATLTSDRHSMR